MGTFKPPSFQDRAALAAKAKNDALEKHLAKATIDRTGIKKPVSGRDAREAARKIKQEKYRQDRNLEKAAREQRASELRDLEALLVEPTDIEQMLAKSARYTPRRKS